MGLTSLSGTKGNFSGVPKNIVFSFSNPVASEKTDVSMDHSLTASPVNTGSPLVSISAYVEYGTDSNLNSFSTQNSSVSVSSAIQLSCSLSNLNPGTTYYIRHVIIINGASIQKSSIYSQTTFTAWAATGGSVSDIGGYRVHTFTSSGSFNVTGYGSKNVEIVIVAGGGSGNYGGAYFGGGGGGAGLVGISQPFQMFSGTRTVIIGAGAAVGSSYGGESRIDTMSGGLTQVIFPLVSVDGGGSGGTQDTNGVSAFGSGGGGGGTSSGAARAGGTASPPSNSGSLSFYANNGGSGGVGVPSGGGGGGGSQSAGLSGGSNFGGNGGNGVSIPSTWTGATTYLGGGGGGGAISAAGTGGLGGGGNGGDSSPISGSPNTGGGGGGGRSNGASGGSGVVYIRYQI